MTSNPSNPPETRPKPVLLFALHALLLSLLLGYWPTPRALYPDLFRAQATALYGADGQLTLQPAPPGRSARGDTLMERAEADGRQRRWVAQLDAVRMGYWPSAVLLALLLATPLGPRRRALGVVAGLAWIQVFALGRLGIEILRAEGEVASGAAGRSDAEGTLLLLRTSSEVLNSNIVVIAAVLLGWVAVAQPSRSLVLGALARVLGSAARLSAGGPSQRPS